MLKPLSPIAPSGKLPVSNNVGIPLELLPIFGFLTWCPAVAGGGRGGLGSLTPVFPCHLTASPGEARADEQPVCGGVRGGLPALGMVSLVAVLPHVWRWRWVPTCPPAPFPPPQPQQCSADGTPSPRRAYAGPEQGYRTQGSLRAAPNPSEVIFDTLEVWRCWVFWTKQAIFKVLKSEKCNLGNQVDRCPEDCFIN